ncbi:SpoIIE family protein phosphatase [Streptomyces sp. NPDC001276]|uniref:SpoIIE family protein phosphatase n=1 Tax=Streptomyces sp. NPDC001276 TaxID=3364555 RepID=UPI00367BBA09
MPHQRALYTDGVIEARDRNGVFYPFAERAAQWTDHAPEALLHRIERDLLAHTGGRFGDDVALLAIHRAPIPHPGNHLQHVQRGHAGVSGQ